MTRSRYARWTATAGLAVVGLAVLVSVIPPRTTSADLLTLAALGLAAGTIVAMAGRMRRALARERRARARLAAAHEAARMTEWEWDVATGRVEMSPSAVAVVGARWRRVEDALASIHPDDRERTEARIAEAVARGEDYRIVCRIVRPGAVGVRWVEARARVQPAADGHGALVSGITLDVTEREEALAASRQAAVALRRSEEKFAKAFTVSPDAVILSRPDDGLIVEANPSFLAVAGRSREEVVGRRSVELGLISAEDRARAVAALRRDGHLREVAVEVPRPNGDRRQVLLSAEPFELDGEPLLVTVMRDVTEQHRAEAGRRESEERLRLALEAGRIGMWTTDLVHDITEGSATNLEMFGFPRDAGPLPTAAWYQRIHPDDHAVVDAAWGTAVAARRPYEVEYRVVRPGGEERWMYSRALFHYDASGAPVRVLGVTLDLTERREAEEALREASRRKDEFLATLAHELRNPLAPMRTSVHLLQLPGLGEAAAGDALEILDRQLTHMVRLIDDLLEVSRLTTGRLRVQREVVSIALVLEHSLEVARPILEGARHTLVVEWPQGPLHVEADLVRLAQVFTNLLVNAARYTPAGGTVALRVREEGTDVVVSVTDTGVGIAPAMLHEIFEMFVRIPQPDGEFHGGLGIGLALARRLVELHGGTLEAQSEGEGRGSTFVVRLPQVPATRLADTRPTGPRHASGAGRLVLVVDDNVDAALTTALLLQQLGYTVRTAHSGREALALAAVETFDVALLDIGLPDMPGYEVARALRRSPRVGTPRLVAITGWGQAEDRARTAEAGFDRHLVKPVGPEVLLRTLDELLATARVEAPTA